ncbi:hepatic lectin isoform X2 [Xenopus laevis]|nr:hepatic lectin isoform X2 [Xenopus laevis]XP_041443152.1 hepatic lectin isoform X2 [Xenopus laevis]
MDTEFSTSCERLDTELGCSVKKSPLFQRRSTYLTYGLLALSYILILTLFIMFLSKASKSETSKDDKSRDYSELKNNVSVLFYKLKLLEETSQRSNCDSGWKEFNGSCYYFSKNTMDWNKARDLCLKRESDLVVITSENEQDFLHETTQDGRYWIGLSDTDEEGIWIWVDGTDYETTYKFWKEGEPNDHLKNEDCAHMWTHGEWNDVPCTYSYCFAICEKRIPPRT